MGSTSFEKVTGDDCAVATAAIANTARTKGVITLPPSQHIGIPSGLKFEADYIAFMPRAHFIPPKKGRTNLPSHYIASPDTTSAPSFRNTSGDVLIFKLRPPPPRMIQSSAIMRSSI